MGPSFVPAEMVVHPDVDAAYQALEAAAGLGRKPQQGMWARFEAAKAMIRQDGLWGEVIRADDIPQYFRDRYGVTNLYCIDLSGTDRCFYTVVARDVVFLDIVDHEAYDQWFPPKGRKRRRK